MVAISVAQTAAVLHRIPYGTNVWQGKILMNGVISDFDEENFDVFFCLAIKCVIILLLYALLAVIATLWHVAHVHLVMTFFLWLSTAIHVIMFIKTTGNLILEIIQYNTDYLICTLVWAINITSIEVAVADPAFQKGRFHPNTDT